MLNVLNEDYAKKGKGCCSFLTHTTLKAGKGGAVGSYLPRVKRSTPLANSIRKHLFFLSVKQLQSLSTADGFRTAELSLHDKATVTSTTKHCGTTTFIVSSFGAWDVLSRGGGCTTDATDFSSIFTCLS